MSALSAWVVGPFVAGVKLGEKPFQVVGDGHAVARRECGKLHATAVEESIAGDDHLDTAFG